MEQSKSCNTDLPIHAKMLFVWDIVVGLNLIQHEGSEG